MLRSIFRAHGQLVASHPLEVVITMVTIIMSLVSMGTTMHYHHEKVCGWNYQCAKEQKLGRTDVIWLSLVRCLALVYVYLQFRSLRKHRSKHLLGISGVFTILSSFIFCIAFVKLLGNTLTGIHEALPFFLLLIDLSKASALAVFALSSSTRHEIKENIGKGMELLGPAITLDAIVEILAIGIGTLSGVPQVETMCSFGCLSVAANYVAFMAFYPACLSLVLELTMERETTSGNVGQYKEMAKDLIAEQERKPNPVTQRVKIIMSVSLAIVHIHKRFIAPQLTNGSVDVMDHTDKYQEPEMSFIQFYLYRLFAVHMDYGLTLVLGIFLLLRYWFVDRHIDDMEFSHTLRLQKSLCRVSSSTQTDEMVQEECVEEDIRTSFSIGDGSSDEEDSILIVKHSQTDKVAGLSPLKRLISRTEPRPLEQCVALLKAENGVQELSDEEIKLLVGSKHIPSYKLEGMLGDMERGVAVRRQILAEKLSHDDTLDFLPYADYDYSYVYGSCCENVIGYMPLPVGVAGPLTLNGEKIMVPMATTEGCLVASTNRGCNAITQSGGVHSTVIGDGMSRGPVVRFPSAMKASEVKLWLDKSQNFKKVKENFDMTSRFGKLEKLHAAQAGRLLYIRFVAKTGDAMGMNMVSKGSERALNTLKEVFPDMEILSLSGNYCTDKKPSAINWIEGRGKSVVCEAIIPAHVVKNTLKTSVPALIDLNISKNLIGSAMAGSIGGYNAHAANIVTAIYIATGQDPAQCVASCNCITLMEATGEHNEDLYITCTMPSLEVGTIGGGTILPPQAACLQMLGVQGSSEIDPGTNAKQLAQIVCGTVLAGELSLMSALAAGHLVRSHLKYNRSSISIQGKDVNLLGKHSVSQSTISETIHEHNTKEDSHIGGPKQSQNPSDQTIKCEAGVGNGKSKVTQEQSVASGMGTEDNTESDTHVKCVNVDQRSEKAHSLPCLGNIERSVLVERKVRSVRRKTRSESHDENGEELRDIGTCMKHVS